MRYVYGAVVLYMLCNAMAWFGIIEEQNERIIELLEKDTAPFTTIELLKEREGE